MYLLHPFQSLFFASLAASLPSQNHAPRDQLSKRALPPLDVFPEDPTGQAHKNALAEALSDTLLLAQQVSLSYPGDDGSGPYKDIWSKYFPESDHSKVQGVWNKIMSDPNNPGQGEDRLKTAVIVGIDLIKINLNVELCEEGAVAYTNPLPAGFDPGLPTTATFTFFCDEAYTLTGRYGDISCSTVGDTVSTKMDFLGGSILHEWMHNDAIGAEGTGGAHIVDYSTPEDARAGYGPYKTRQLLINDPTKCITNADSFLWLAYEILWTKSCLTGSSRFKDPAPDNTIASAVPSIPSPLSLTGSITDAVPVTATIPPLNTPISSSPTPPTPPPPPPYATGTCSFHLTETQDCDSNYGNNLYGNVVMKDNNKAIIGQTVNDDDHPIGYSMDDGNSYSFESKLPQPLVITGEHESDYVQFTYGSLSWQSKAANGGGSCTVGGWDPRDGPVCGLRSGNTNAVNNMDCSFPC